MKNADLIPRLISKMTLQKEVYNNTFETFSLLKTIGQSIIHELSKNIPLKGDDVTLRYKDHGTFEFEMQFGRDILIFSMHTDVFEFSRNHEVMKTPYVQESPDRSYCGMIRIYNFLSDSFLYQRENDLGYMIGRLFVNNEKHYFLEGKKEVGLLYTNFNTSIITEDSARNIIESAIFYTINFDLLTPPFDDVKLLTVAEVKNNQNTTHLRTGKRIGFEFKADKDF